MDVMGATRIAVLLFLSSFAAMSDELPIRESERSYKLERIMYEWPSRLCMERHQRRITSFLRCEN